MEILEKKTFLVTVSVNNTRDTQIATQDEAPHEDDTLWKDFQGEVVVGNFKTYTRSEALHAGAAYAGVSVDALDAYELKVESK